MRKWTCCIMSAVLLTLSSIPQTVYSGAVDTFRSFIVNAVTFFIGIGGTENTVLAVEPDDITDEQMMIEIENIRAETEREAFEAKSETLPVESTVQERKKILIYHTHTDEAYLKTNEDYVETSAGRTLDQSYSVVSVGTAFKENLEECGFGVIHDKTDNVSAGFNKAYQTSYETIEKYIGSVDIYVDMHRDAYAGKEPNFLTSDGVGYAYICFVVANGENYSDKPHWQENYKLAQELTNKLNELCPGIAKKVIFRNARYNQHISDSCLLIEMGNEKNTLAEVKASASVLAKAFDAVL